LWQDLTAQMLLHFFCKYFDKTYLSELILLPLSETAKGPLDLSCIKNLPQDQLTTLPPGYFTLRTANKLKASNFKKITSTKKETGRRLSRN
jgi:hypothetical protein